MARTTRKYRRPQAPKLGRHGVICDANIGKRHRNEQRRKTRHAWRWKPALCAWHDHAAAWGSVEFYVLDEPEFVNWGYDASDDPFYDDEPCGLYCGDPQHDHPFVNTDPRSVEDAPVPHCEQPTSSERPRRDSDLAELLPPHVHVRTAQQQTTTILPKHLRVPEMAELRRDSSHPVNLGLRRPRHG